MNIKLIKLLSPLIVGCVFCISQVAVLATPIPEDCRTGGFAIGCQAWSFKEYSVLEAIDKTAAAGGKVIEFYPGQKFSPDQPDVKFDHNATDDMIATVKARLAERGIRAVNYGVVGIPKDEAGARKIFEFAKKIDLYGITTESVESIDTIEKLVKEYDIHVGFHDHPRQPNNPSYRMWDPNYILSVVKRSRCPHRVLRGRGPLGAQRLEPGGLPEDSGRPRDERASQGPQREITGRPRCAGWHRRFGHPRGHFSATQEGQHFVGNVSRIEYEYNWKE